MKIILLGPIGTGKSTQAKFISKLLKLKHIEIGKEFRKLAKKDKFIKNLVSKGKLAPDNLTLKIVNNLVNNNFILDGFPRTLKQAKMFKEKIDLVLFLNTDKKNIVKRLMLRKRKDDTKKLIERRYHIYLKKTMPVLNYYKKKGVLININGNNSVKQVSKEIKNKLIKYQQQL